MTSLADSLISTGTISPISAASLSDGISLSGAAPLADSSFANNSLTIAQPTGVGNWLDQNVTYPLLNSLGLGSLYSDPITKALDSAGLTTSNNTNFWTDIFLRGVIIILGFIFTAVALTMFGSKAANVVVNETKRSFK